MDSFTQYVLEQLHQLEVHEKRMFGGYGLYYKDTFFAIIYKQELYFKTNKESKEKYCTHAFKPNKKQTLHNYLAVPAHILEDKEELQIWAQEAAKQ
jgi:DNA transformation protein and related proteins